MDWLHNLTDQYLSMTTMQNFNWMETQWTHDINWQKKLVELTINHQISKNYPPSKSYTKFFLKQLITKIEERGFEVHEELYRKYLEVLTEVEQTNVDFCYKSYVVDPSLTIILEENEHFVSDGTTGLCTWQAALSLSEWCYENKNILFQKNVLELGSGIGLLGITASFACSPKTFTFSDVHPKVLQRLKKNISLNVDHYHQKHANRVGHDQIQCSDFAFTTFTKKEISEHVSENCWHHYTDCVQCKSSLPNLQVQEIDWTKKKNIDNYLTNIDIILASDVIYDPSLISPFTKTIGHLLSKFSAVAIVACTERNPDTLKMFQHELESVNIKIESLQTNIEPLFYYCHSLPIKLWKLSSR